jgi:phosphoribosylformylglycinamidine cyclo-ligase
VRAGDAIVGLPSSGLHANGFSLVRAQVTKWDLDLARPYQEQLILTLGNEASASAIAAEPEHALATLGQVLLTPTAIYAGALLRVRTELQAAGHDLHGLAHITGGGLSGNVHRALPAGLAARLDPSTWRMPSIVRLIGALGGLDDVELRATFNGGLGMVAVVGPEAVPATLAGLAEEGIVARVVGEVVPAEGGARYVEGPLSR